MILSDIVWMTNITSPNRVEIEDFLTKKCGNLIRWAIVDICDNKLKINVTYKKGYN